MRSFFLFFIILILCRCHLPDTTIKIDTKKQQEAIVQKYLLDSAHSYSYNSPYWSYYIDKGLQKDSTIAYLWQQKAMPLFKQGKYELGMTYLDKAVYYDSSRWLSYRAFIKCIFSKTYEDAIVDFEKCIALEGNSYVMDHSYLFYIALSKIQLNRFQEAELILNDEIKRIEETLGPEWTHHLVLFYYVITLYEQQKYAEAIKAFDKALVRYPKFSDAQYYKFLALHYMNPIVNKEASQKLYEEAIKNLKMGYTINEDNAIYERYPYQLRLSHFVD